MSGEENTTDAAVLELEEEVCMEEARDAPVEETPDEAAHTAEKTTVVDVDIDETQLPLFIVFVASIILMIATGIYYGWNIAVSQVTVHARSASTGISFRILLPSYI